MKAAFPTYQLDIPVKVCYKHSHDTYLLEVVRNTLIGYFSFLLTDHVTETID